MRGGGVTPAPRTGAGKAAVRSSGSVKDTDSGREDAKVAGTMTVLLLLHIAQHRQEMSESKSCTVIANRRRVRREKKVGRHTLFQRGDDDHESDLQMPVNKKTV